MGHQALSAAVLTTQEYQSVAESTCWFLAMLRARGPATASLNHCWTLDEPELGSSTRPEEHHGYLERDVLVLEWAGMGQALVPVMGVSLEEDLVGLVA